MLLVILACIANRGVLKMIARRHGTVVEERHCSGAAKEDIRASMEADNPQARGEGWRQSVRLGTVPCSIVCGARTSEHACDLVSFALQVPDWCGKGAMIAVNNYGKYHNQVGVVLRGPVGEERRVKIYLPAISVTKLVYWTDLRPLAE